MPIAGISSRCASASIGVIFAAPSSIEYSVWLCRCTKEEEFIGPPVYGGAPTVLGVSRRPRMACRGRCLRRSPNTLVSVQWTTLLIDRPWLSLIPAVLLLGAVG